MQVGVPELDFGLVLPPPLVDQQAVDDAGAVVLSAGVFGGFEDLLRDDLGIRRGDVFDGQLEGDAFLDQVADAEGDFGDGFGGDGGDERVFTVAGEDCGC